MTMWTSALISQHISAKGPAGTFSTYLAPNDMAWVKDTVSRKAEMEIKVV
jgi:hypothetical protein